MINELSTPTIVFGHSGKQHAYRLALAFQRLGHLNRFVTSGYYKPGTFPDRVFSKSRKLDTLLKRRHLATLDSTRVARRWDLEFPELLYRGLGGSGELGNLLVMIRDLRFDRWAAKRWAESCDIYWGFQGSCLRSLRVACQAGALGVAEFPIAHITMGMRILAEEGRRHPEWADTIGTLKMPQWYRERLEREPHEADFCIAASGFTKKSLLEVGIQESKIRLLPLGVDVVQFSETKRSSKAPFRILFVGGVGQRKGIKYLLEAVKKLHSTEVELVLVGPILGSGKALSQYSGLCKCLGRVDQHRVVEELYRSHVLVLPSVFEGFGLVIPEAMATGIPVIASTHSSGPEIIENGREGFVLEPDDIDGLAEKIDWLASNRERACEMGSAAAQKAQTVSWSAHEENLAEIITEIWKARSPERADIKIAALDSV
jgi:alpha-maltose-1-phosphate synthase